MWIATLRIAMLFCAVVLLGLMAPSVGHAAVFEVNNTEDDAGDNDPGDGNCRVALSVSVLNRCTLRAAIEEANATAAVDTITLPAGAVRVTRSLPNVTRSLTITGRGAGATTIMAIPNTLEVFNRLLSTQPGSTLTLRITGVTIQGNDGNTLQRAQSGLFCDTSSTCFITNSVLRFFLFEALQARRANLTVTGSTITANGTGVLNAFEGVTTIESSSVSGNTQGVRGPAFQGAGGLVNSEFGTLRIFNSTVAGNSNGDSANTGAGGIQNEGLLEITNSTIANNSASASGSASAIALVKRDVTLRHVTIAGNSGRPALANPGILPANVSATNSVLSNNSPANCGAPLTLLVSSSNLDSGVSCGFNPATNLVSTAANLGALVNNGGPTATLLPALGSPVIDRVSCTVLADQRGVSRPRDGDGVGQILCDLGSVERGAPPEVIFPPLGVPNLAPSDGTAKLNDLYVLTFGWEVPAPQNWGTLRSLDLRLRSAGQVVFGLRWDQLTDLFQLLDANGNPQDPGHLAGTPLLLGNGPVKLDLESTRTLGSGITGQHVSLTLPLRIEQSLGGSVLQIDVSGTGDDGNTDPYVQIGTITVLAVTAATSDVDKREREKEEPTTELGRLKRARSNDGGFDEERAEGNVMGVRCDRQELDVAGIDGIMLFKLRGESRGVCASIKIGDYVGADGQKEHELLFWVDEITIEK